MIKKRQKIVLFIISLVLPQLAGFVGAMATFRAVDTWYQEIAKPALTPPSWVFGPVWTLLYLLMGVALYLVLLRPEPKKRAVTLFSFQLVFNALWSVLFFGVGRFDLAFVELCLLWGFILLTYIHFRRLDRRAGRLLVPYLVWVSFAGYLNLTFWLINR